MKSESGKLIMIFWCIFVFMVCGFEHSIANMSSIGISLFTGKVGIGAYLYNVVVVTLGNMVGGILGVALPYHLISKENKIKNKKVELSVKAALFRSILIHKA